MSRRICWIRVNFQESVENTAMFSPSGRVKKKKSEWVLWLNLLLCCPKPAGVRDSNWELAPPGGDDVELQLDWQTLFCVSKLDPRKEKKNPTINNRFLLQHHYKTNTIIHIIIIIIINSPVMLMYYSVMRQLWLISDTTEVKGKSFELPQQQRRQNCHHKAGNPSLWLHL